MELRGTTALVTGATGGLGAAIARSLHDRGAHLLLAGRRQDRLEEMGRSLGDAVALRCDLADADQLVELAGRAADADVVVHAAALPATGRIQELDGDDLDRAVRVNLHAPMELTRLLVPGLLRRGRGHLVFVSSISGKLATPRMSVYAATKFGLRGFAAGLRQDLRGTGVGVSTILPGPVADAGMWVDAGVEPPARPRPRRAIEVGEAVLRAVEGDRAEVHVSRAAVRGAVLLSDVAPDLVSRLLSAQGADDLGDRFAAGTAAKR